MRRTLLSILAIALGACGSGDDLPAPDDAQQVPPANAVEVTIVTAGIDGTEVAVRGDAPTPCHELGWLLEQTDTAIDVTVWAVPGDEACVQVVDPFEISVSFDPPDAEVPVRVNGEEIGRVG